jgi:hypothetical protein
MVPSAFDAAPIATMPCPLVEMSTEVIPVELASLRNHPHHVDAKISFLRQLHPRIDVRMMVELGDDDLIAFGKPAAQRSRERGA